MSLTRLFTATLLCFFSVLFAWGQIVWAENRLITNKAALDELAELYQRQLEARRGALYSRLLQSVEPAQKALNEDRNIRLWIEAP